MSDRTITLPKERTKNGQGIAYSRATFAFVRRLTPDEVKKAQEYHEMLKPLVQKMPIDLDASDVHEE